MIGRSDGRPSPGKGMKVEKRSALSVPAVSALLAAVMAVSGCSGSPGSGAQRSARPCSTPAAPWLKPGGRAAGDVRWVVRLDSCYAGNKAAPDGRATFASAATPALTVAFFAGRAWGVDTATGRVRWTRQVPQARRLPAQPPGSEIQDAVVAVLPHDVVIGETTQLQHGSGGRCGCGTGVADLNPATGAVRHVSWIPLPGGVSYVGGGKVITVVPSDPGRANGMIAAVDPASGKAWTRHHLGIGQDTGLAVAGQVLYTDLPQLAAGKARRERYLDAYSLRTGASLPRLRLPEASDGIAAAPGGSAPGQPALPDAAGHLLVSAGPAMDSVDARTGSLAWRIPGGDPFPGEVVAPSQHAVWTWRGSRLFAYDLSTGKIRTTAPVSRQECWGSIPDPPLAFTALGAASMLCPQHADPSQPYSAVRLRLFSLATGRLAGSTGVLPGWSSGSLAGHLALGITCQGPQRPGTWLPGRCSEFDLVAISTG